MPWELLNCYALLQSQQRLRSVNELEEPLQALPERLATHALWAQSVIKWQEISGGITLDEILGVTISKQAQQDNS